MTISLTRPFVRSRRRHVVKLAQDRERAIALLHGHALGDFELEQRRIDVVFADDALDHPDEVALIELARRHVHAYAHGRVTACAP